MPNALLAKVKTSAGEEKRKQTGCFHPLLMEIHVTVKFLQLTRSYAQRQIKLSEIPSE